MIGIITPGNKKYTPYIENYLSILDSKNVEYKVMSWDKRNLVEDGVDMRFDYPINDSNRKKMVLGYIKFIKRCKSYIKKNEIDKLIILTAAPAFFMGLSYLSKFTGNFIFDIRDDSPFIRRFPKRFKKICAMAKTVVVSSGEFTPWTGRKTILCHNADLEQLRLHIDDEPTLGHQNPIRIVFAGVMIEGQCNVEVLKAFRNDSRFVHAFIGRDSIGKKIVQNFVASIGMRNVTFDGAYNKEDIIDIYRGKADLINIFRAKTTINRNALPNKLYEAVLAGRPIVVFEHNVAISNYANKFNLGIVLPEEMNQMSEYVFNRIQSFDYNKYAEGRKLFLEQVDDDMKNYENAVIEFISSTGRFVS